MARFYGTVDGGGATKASRRGHATLGLTTVAASYSGAVEVSLYVRPDGTDCAHIKLVPWKGSGVTRVLFDGPVSGELPCPKHGGLQICATCDCEKGAAIADA